MGQQQSNLQQSRIEVPSIGTLKRIKQGMDVRYGEIKVMETQDAHLVAVKDHVFQEQGQWNSFKSEADKTINNRRNETFLVKMMDLQHLTEKELCTQMTQAHSVYEFFPLDLEKEIEDVRIAKSAFDEIEITAMLYCTLISLIALQQQHKHHGDIRPSTISLTAYSKHNPMRKNEVILPVYKLTDILTMTDMNAFRRCIAKMKGEYNLSPEILLFLKQKILRPQYDAIKSDIFSIGLVGLQMARLNNLQDIYDFSNYQINKEHLDSHIQQMRRQYSEQLSSIICEFLQFAPENRPDVHSAYSLLYPYEFQLEDYFNNSTLKSMIPDYSVSIKASQNQRSIEQPILNNITNIQPQQLYHQIEILDDRAKEALKKSHEAQMRYLNTNQKQVRFDGTKNYQNYSNLQPILMQEIVFQNAAPRIELQDAPSNRQSSYYYQYQSPQQQMIQPQLKYNNDSDHNQDNDEEAMYQAHDIDEQPPKQSYVEQFDPTNYNNNKSFNQMQSYPQQQQYQQQQQFQQQSVQRPETYQELKYSGTDQDKLVQQTKQEDIQQYLGNRSIQGGNQSQSQIPILRQSQHSQQNLDRQQERQQSYKESVTRVSQHQIQQQQSPGMNQQSLYPKMDQEQDRKTPLNQIQQEEEEDIKQYLTGSSNSVDQSQISQRNNQGVPPVTKSQRTKKPGVQSSQKVVQSQKSVVQSKVSRQSIRK